MSLRVRAVTAVTAVTAVLLGGAVAGAAQTTAATGQGSPLSLRVLSGRADLVTGENSLLEVVIPTGARGLRVTVNGVDVTRSFARDADGRLLGRVHGLRRGANTVVARADGATGARLTLTDHPITGPVFSGPQVQPWICSTAASGLGKPLDAQCSAATKVFWFYKSTNPSKTGLQPYDPAKPASDVATTTTDQGRTVPYIVRNERGTLNRTIYDIAMLFEPGKPVAAQRGWNHKLGYPFGGGCAPNHLQTNNSSAVLDDLYLSRGFAVASAGLNVLGNNCNEVVSAETIMMVKERLAEGYGPIRYTIGNGCSGGSIQQNVIANQYPGLLDGIQPSCTYPDSWTTGIEVYDCRLLLDYFDTSPLFPPGSPQRGAVTGQESETPCRSWRDVYGFAPTVGDPRIGCEGLILGPQVPTYTPPAYVYDPVKNPRGARCTKQDYEVAILGKRPDGKAKNAYDNVGVQYGLQALQSGKLTAEQFLDLNEKVGGQDIDYANTPARSAADPGAVATLYRSGRINDARGLRNVPIIDLRGADNYEIHTDYNSYVLRERLKRSNGTDANYAMFTAMTPLVVPAAVTKKAFLLMDRWLAGIEADHSALSLPQKVLKHKPTEAVDTCFVGDQAVTDPTTCRHALPYFSNPRIAAGEPFTNDVAKCQLKPLVRTDFAAGTFTDAQWDRLRAVFPGGVCNYAVPGVDQQYAAGIWTSFAGGPGGRSLGAAPAATRG